MPTQDGFDYREWALRPGLREQVLILNTETPVTANGRRIVGLVHTMAHMGGRPHWPAITYDQMLQARREDPRGHVIGMCQGCIIHRPQGPEIRMPLNDGRTLVIPR